MLDYRDLVENRLSTEWIEAQFLHHDLDVTDKIGHLSWIERLWAHCGMPPISENSIGCTDYERESLRDYLEGRTNVETAARRIMSFNDEQVPILRASRGSKGCRVSHLLYNIGFFLVDKQLLILALVEQIRRQPTPHVTAEQMQCIDAVYQQWGMSWKDWHLDSWAQLADFHYSWRGLVHDHWDDQRESFKLADGKKISIEPVWESFQAKFCLLNRRCTVEIGQALDTIIRTLEFRPWIASGRKERLKKKETDEAIIWSKIWAKAVKGLPSLLEIFSIIGRIIYSKRNTAKDLEMELSNQSMHRFNLGTQYWKGGLGCSKERWEFWKESLRFLARHTNEIGEFACQLALRVVTVMERIEQDPETKVWQDWIQEGEGFAWLEERDKAIKLEKEKRAQSKNEIESKNEV